MDPRKRIAIAAFLLVATISNYVITENDNVRAVQFVSIFAIGALTAVVIRELLGIYRNR